MAGLPDASRALAESPRALIEVLQHTDWNELGRELERLLAVEKWAIEQIGFTKGGRVRFRETWQFPDRADAPGWWHYRECLIPGATAEVVDIKFSPYLGGWRVDIRLDQEWSVGQEGWPNPTIKRYWHGSLDTTPEGYIPPSTFDQEHYPEGRRHLFMMRPESLERIG